MRIVLLNAPPGSGKDTAADYLSENGWIKFSIADPLKKMVHGIYGLSDRLGIPKNIPLDALGSKTLRECYISHGEHMKALHGQDYWINQTIDLVNLSRIKCPNGNIVIADVGFPIELNRIVEEFGEKHRVTLVKIRRKGHDYRSDSRRELSENIESFGIGNDGTLEDFYSLLKAVFC